MNHFNIRVYGICIENEQILLTDEIRMGIRMTKLPGGGLHLGEGLEDALQREWMEELKAEIKVGDIFYVNPFLQPSAFSAQDQIIAMYFWTSLHSPPIGEFRDKPFDFPNGDDDQQVFRWVPVSELHPTHFTFPIDQSLVPKLLAYWKATKKSHLPPNGTLRTLDELTTP